MSVCGFFLLSCLCVKTVNKICCMSRGSTWNVKSDKQSKGLLAHIHSYFMHTLSTVYYYPPLGLGLGSLICVTALCSMQMLLQL